MKITQIHSYSDTRELNVYFNAFYVLKKNPSVYNTIHTHAWHGYTFFIYQKNVCKKNHREEKIFFVRWKNFNFNCRGQLPATLLYTFTPVRITYYRLCLSVECSQKKETILPSHFNGDTARKKKEFNFNHRITMEKMAGCEI